jgi:hypothetical protein
MPRLERLGGRILEDARIPLEDFFVVGMSLLVDRTRSEMQS